MLPAAPGEWYISVVCEVCKRRVLLFRDLSKGKSKVEKSWISLKCPECHQNTSSQIEHYLEPSNRPSDELSMP